jgi:hypothetical protein
MPHDENRPIKPARVLAMSALLVASAAAMLKMVSVLPPTPTAYVVSFLLGVCLTPLLASFYEWLVHRYIYHRRLLPGLGRIYEIHHHSHHHIFFPTWRYVTSGPPRRLPILGSDLHEFSTDGVANALTRAGHFSFYFGLGLVLIITPAWLSTRDPALIAGSLVALAVISNLFITVHDTIHRPGSHPLLEKQFWFRFLDNHHYIHHVDTSANVNFLLPLADWLFGTLRLELTAEEERVHGSKEAAKSLPAGTGEPAREARRQRRTQAGAEIVTGTG